MRLPVRSETERRVTEEKTTCSSEVYGDNDRHESSILFRWLSTLGKLFTHIASPVSQLQETGVQKGSFRRLSGHGD